MRCCRFLILYMKKYGVSQIKTRIIKIGLIFPPDRINTLGHRNFWPASPDVHVRLPIGILRRSPSALQCIDAISIWVLWYIGTDVKKRIGKLVTCNAKVELDGNPREEKAFHAKPY